MSKVKPKDLLFKAGPFVFCLLLTGFFFLPQTKTVRVSFLDDSSSLADTAKLLRGNGCPESAIEGFEKAVRYYYRTPLAVDLRAFPAPTNGFYLFDSGEAFASALNKCLFGTEHLAEINCLDVALYLAGNQISTTLNVDSTKVQVIAEVNRGGDNRPWAQVTASPHEAFQAMYYPWYTNTVKAITGLSYPDKQICLTTCFKCFRLVPQDSNPKTTGKSLIRALRSQWGQQGVTFSKKIQLILLHRVDVQHQVSFAEHAGLLLPNKRGYTYIEKSGIQGPFLRIDLVDPEDLAPYYGTLISGRWNNQFPRSFMTANDRLVTEVIPRPFE